MEIFTFDKKDVKHSKGENFPNENNTSWLRLINPSEEQLKKVSKKYDLKLEDLQDYSKQEERPRLEKKKGYIETIFDAPAVESDDLVARPIFFFISKKTLISLETKNFLPLERHAQNLRKNRRKFSMKRGPFFILSILMDDINDAFLNRVNQVDQISDVIETKAENASEKELNSLYDANITLTHFNQSLIANLEVLNQIRKIRTKGINEDLRNEFYNLYYDCLQIIDSLKIQREIVANLFNFQSILSTNKLNQSIKKLTSLALIVLLPTLITGAYGMNIKLPFANSEHAFLIISIISFLIVIIVFIIFRKAEWV
ncbi:MAG: magnesium transporter CorA family protein [Nanobdellota archaeon]